MKTIGWALLLVIGFGMMLGSYLGFQRVTDPTPWTHAAMFVGQGEPESPGNLDLSPGRVRFLPTSPEAEIFLAEVQHDLRGRQGRLLASALQEAVVLDPNFREHFTAEMLASGRLPEPESEEAVAGCSAVREDWVEVQGRLLRIVGVFRRGVGLFADAYVVPGDSAAADLFDPSDPEVEQAYFLRASAEDQTTPAWRKHVTTAFPARRFRAMTGFVRVDPASYYAYLGGQALLFLGGTGLFVWLYGYLAGRVRNRVLAHPLGVIQEWRVLFWAVHLVVFGTVILLAALVYPAPSVQKFLLALVQQNIQSGKGPLGVAGSAYLSGNIPWAAAVTLGVNFALGSVATITLPSVVVPGIGALMAWLRAGAVGVILAPSMVALSERMIPHSFTVLLEMEAYILATFFALMIPIYLFRRQEGPTVVRRYGRALLLNLKANVLIFLVLLVAAVYEAVEVILSMT